MLKITALNEESEEESDSEEDVTREALEQIALQQYAKALELQRKSKLKEAAQLLKDLLDTELLYDIKKPEYNEKAKEPLINLKYLCYKNLASILSLLGENHDAVEAYFSAAALDDTDLTLWYRLGLLCFKTHKFETALHAFRKGCECNPKHWPCIDKIITLLLGLEFYNDCIIAIYDAFELDSGYMRGLVYRHHIATTYPHVLEYMSHWNSKYAWKPDKHESYDTVQSAQLLKEADDITQSIIKQDKENTFKSDLPTLKLKPLANLSWSSVAENLVHMHNYITEKCYSHASIIEIVLENEKEVEKMDIVIEAQVEPKVDEVAEGKPEENGEEKNAESSENENNELSDKNGTDTEKVESESDNQQNVEKQENKDKEQNKSKSRRRASDLSYLQQWEWCTRRSSRKKTTTKQDFADETIYDTLRRLIPASLTLEVHENKEQLSEKQANSPVDNSPDTMDLYRLFEEKQEVAAEDSLKEKINTGVYFRTEKEIQDVTEFVMKFKNCDIITLLQEFLDILSKKWQLQWSKNLCKFYVKAVKCYESHCNVPTCMSEDDEVNFYVRTSILCQELIISEKLLADADEKEYHFLDVVDGIGFLLRKTLAFGEECLSYTLRFLWLKCHCYIYNKNEDLALDALYHILCEFNSMGEHHDTFSLNVVNFSVKPIISKSEVESYIKFLERNKKLSTVMALYDIGNYEQVLEIVTDSFEHCKTMARKQQCDEMSLDFAVQLSLILDCFWSLGKVVDCLKWCLTCLHEGLKHYLMCTTGTTEHEKWSLTVVKVLVSIEHILKTEGLGSLEEVSPKDISQAIQDLIQIIGHQIDETGTEMPLNTVAPWIILHYFLQREEDHGRSTLFTDRGVLGDEIPCSIMALFLSHEYLGEKSWCCKSEGKLLYFILDTIIPRLHTPALSKPMERICQYLEQCVFCLFGHPGKKNRLKHLIDHNVTPFPLDWARAQQVYELFKPVELPSIEGSIGISADTEQLLQRIKALIPTECEPQKYVLEITKYIEGKVTKIPTIPIIMPFKMKDIYFLLGDYHFKKDERYKSLKYNTYDVVINCCRFESWAEIALAKSTNLEVKLNSGTNMKSDMGYITEALQAVRCFKRAVELDPLHCTLWIEYGAFVYSLHSFCSRLLKQASESLSMEDFESIEKQKEDMLDTSENCFKTALTELDNSCASDDRSNDELWLHLYLLGKISEKRNKSPTEYLDFYIKAAKSLEENEATYPSKINYNAPQQLSIEALEVQYRIHASILKYIEQHENKVVPMSEGKAFLDCLEQCQNGPFSKKKKEVKKDSVTEIDPVVSKPSDTPVSQASAIYKRSISDAGEVVEIKKAKLETSSKPRRASSYESERNIVKDDKEVVQQNPVENNVINMEVEEKVVKNTQIEKVEENVVTNGKAEEPTPVTNGTETQNENKETPVDTDTKKEDSSTNASKEDSSSSSSSDSSSEDSSSDTSSSSSSNSNATAKSIKSNENKPMSEEDISKITSACLDALEDVVSRFPQHYKALYRLAHYHFYYKKGKDIERCRDIMLSNFISRSNQKLLGLFCERKNHNFFSGIWRIPTGEVDRPGSFAVHMSRCVLLSMEILKEIDDHKTLLDLSMHLRRIPEPDKTYLRDSEREELAQQAFSLCVQSLRGQLTKFSQQADLKSNDTEKKALNSLMLDIYRAYQKVQKQPQAKQFTNLLVEAYKLVSVNPVNENANLVDASMRHCQTLLATLKQQATMAQQAQAAAKKQIVKTVDKQDVIKPAQANTAKPDPKAPSLPIMSPQEIANAFQSYLPRLNDSLLSQQTAAALTLSYMSNLTQLAGYTSLQSTLESTIQNSLQNTFQAEFYRQFLASNLNPSYSMQQPKKQQKRNKPNYTKPLATSTSNPNLTNTQKPKLPTTAKSFSSTAIGSVKPTSLVMPSTSSSKSVTSISSMQKSVSIPTSIPITPMQKSVSMPTSMPMTPIRLSPLPTTLSSSFGSAAQPAHMSTTVSYVSSSSAVQPAHITTTSTVSAALQTKPPLPHQQVSPGKTLQEKLAERQKNLPAISKSLSSTSQDLVSSISKLPSSLTVTKTGVKSTIGQSKEFKKVEARKKPTHSFQNVDSLAKPSKPLSCDEVIVLDDDDD